MGAFDASTGNSYYPSIVASDRTDALDIIIDGLVFNGPVRGNSGVPGDDGTPWYGIDVVASQIGDVTFSVEMNIDNIPEGGWNDTNIVRDFGILATPSFEYSDGANPDNQDVLDGLIEQVALDGSNLSDYTIGNITVETSLGVPWTGTSLFDGQNFFIALGGIGDINIDGGVAGGQQTSLFEDDGDGVWFVAGDVAGLRNTDADLPGGSLGVNTNEDCNLSDATSPAADTDNPDWDDAVVSIGNVTINARQTDGTTDVSGVDFISGDDGYTYFAGFGILSGVVADDDPGTDGVAVYFSPNYADTDFVQIGEFADEDTGMIGNIGNIFLTSDKAVLFREDFNYLEDIDLYDNDFDVDLAGIVLSGSTGTIQFLPGIAGYNFGDNGTQAVILGDQNATTDNEISDTSFYLLDGDNGFNEIIVVVVGENGQDYDE